LHIIYAGKQVLMIGDPSIYAAHRTDKIVDAYGVTLWTMAVRKLGWVSGFRVAARPKVKETMKAERLIK
jgi:hypothetical protein